MAFEGAQGALLFAPLPEFGKNSQMGLHFATCP